MTIRQEAYRLLDGLSEDGVRAVVGVMLQMTPKQVEKEQDTDKMKAFKKVQELRKITAAKYEVDIEEARKEGLMEKYGRYM